MQMASERRYGRMQEHVESKISCKSVNGGETNLSRLEFFIGIADEIDNTKDCREICVIVDTVLSSFYQGINDQTWTSIITPGTKVIIRGEYYTKKPFSEGDKLKIIGTVEKHKENGISTYVINDVATLGRIDETEAKELIINDMVSVAKRMRPKEYGDCSLDFRSGNLFLSLDRIIKEEEYKQFLSDYTPMKITEELNSRIVGQSDLTMGVANFLYYHALRQIKPELPPRSMIIAGPSGSGKTEVWRVAKTLFGKLFNISIINGSIITQEGWRGDDKLSSHIDKEIASGGILVVDEFDKLAEPDVSSTGVNVAAKIQTEFLKLLEGEYVKVETDKSAQSRSNSSKTTETKLETKGMGIVLVGAFESIREKRQSKVGFGVQNEVDGPGFKNMTDEEYIEFGVLPELVGRLAIKVTTNQLGDNDYIQIINNPHSRVSVISNTLKEFGADVDNVVNENELREMIRRSKSNKTGVRWILSQVENKLLENLWVNGVGDLNKATSKTSEEKLNSIRYTKENIVDGINAKLDLIYGNDPNRKHFCEMCKIMMNDYPVEIEQNILEWINGIPLTEIDVHGMSVKRVMAAFELTDDCFPLVVRNFKRYKSRGFKGGTHICCFGLI